MLWSPELTVGGTLSDVGQAGTVQSDALSVHARVDADGTERAGRVGDASRCRRSVLAAVANHAAVARGSIRVGQAVATVYTRRW